MVLPECYYFPWIKQNLISEFATKLYVNPRQVERGFWKKKKSMCSQLLLSLTQFLVLPNKNWEEEKGIKLTCDCVWEQEKKSANKKVSKRYDYTMISGEN